MRRATKKAMKLFDVSTDFTCDLKKPYVDEHNVWFVPLTFIIEKDGKIEDGLDEESLFVNDFL